MKLLLCLCLAFTLTAQEKRRQETAPALPSDKKALDPKVPEATTVSAQFERIVVVRLKHQADILNALSSAVKEQNIQNAIILSGFGSATSTHFHVVANRSFPPANAFIENEKNGVDIVNINGAVLKGRVHCHITYADADKAFGGHLEPRSQAFTFAVITLGVLPPSIDMSRFDDYSLR